MFRSTHILSGATLYERPAQSAQAFQTALSGLKTRQRAFAAFSAAERAAALEAFGGRLEAESGRLARMICEEVGRCLRECEAEMDKSVSLIRYYAKLAPQLLQHQTIATQASLSQVRFEPLGVVLAVMPWNYPVWQIIRFAVPALCSGNACLVKPAPSVARVTAALFDIVGSELPWRAAWLAHEDVEHAIAQTDALAFTGSANVGRRLAGYAGSHLKKCVMELGGSNAFIVLDDADIAQAAADACYARFRDAGQSCNAGKRIILTEGIAAEFTRLFLEHCRHLTPGCPLDPDTTLAPLHRKDLQLQVHEQVQDALEHGARLLLGGELPNEADTTFYPATVLDNITPACRMYREEVFGPAVGIFHARDAADAVRLANDNPFGLGASIYSANLDKAWSLGQQIEAGSVFINRHTSSDLRLPFGGVKDSGFGRELSEFGLYEFVNVKAYWQK